MNQQRIMIMEGDDSIRELLYESLSTGGYNVDTVCDGIEGLAKIKEYVYDLIILDMNISKLDAFTACKVIRKKSEVPIIFISKACDEATQIKAYDLGCDDFIEIPFSYNIMIKKIGAILRKTSSRNETDTLEFGDMVLGLNTYTVSVSGREVELTLKEFNILKTLIIKYPQVVTREGLLDSIWGYDFFGDTRIIDAHIKNIRRKIGKNYIKTVKGIGYSLEK